MSLNSIYIVLASGSPRRQELLRSLNYTFSVLKLDFNEDYPTGLNPQSVPSHLSCSKINQIPNKTTNTLYIAADTLVILQNEILGKPKNHEAAFEMLKKLSGKTHDVITGVTLELNNNVITFQETTKVSFHELSDDDINFYIQEYSPYDKAGSYGIQEWIGMIGINKIEGSYYNVMGLPVDILHQKIKDVISTSL